MKYMLFLLLAPLSSSAFCCECFKSKAQKERELLEERAEFIRDLRSNISEPNYYEVSLTTKGKSYRPVTGHYPQEWPRIRRNMPYFDNKTMEWTIVPDTNTVQCVEILGPDITSIPQVATCLTYNWYVKPLAKGTAQVTVRYVSKDGNKIEDLKFITITVTDS